MHCVAPLLLAFLTASAVQDLTAADPAPRALILEYHDGAKITRLLRATGAMWTPAVRRIPGADTARDGKPLAALHLSHVANGDEVTVTVGLAYGAASSTPVLVATVKVAPGKPALVDALRAFGVEPVTLSLGTIATSMPYPPTVTSPSSVLEARAELVAANVPTYQIVLTNRSPIPLMSLRLEGYRGEKVVISGLRRDERNYPLVDTGRERTFLLNVPARRNPAGDGSASWEGLDRVVITYVKWADGLVEGSRERDFDRVFYTSRERYISRLLDMLRATPVRSPAELMTMVNSLQTSEVVARQVEEILVRDLEVFNKGESANQPGAFAAWMGNTIRDLEQWRDRLRRQLR
jgi:hypothetical protein